MGAKAESYLAKAAAFQRAARRTPEKAEEYLRLMRIYQFAAEVAEKGLPKREQHPKGPEGSA